MHYGCVYFSPNSKMSYNYLFLIFSGLSCDYTKNLLPKGHTQDYFQNKITRRFVCSSLLDLFRKQFWEYRHDSADYEIYDHVIWNAHLFHFWKLSRSPKFPWKESVWVTLIFTTGLFSRKKFHKIWSTTLFYTEIHMH